MLNGQKHGTASKKSLWLDMKVIAFLFCLVENGYLHRLFESDRGRLGEWAGLRSRRVFFVLMFRKTLPYGENRVDNDRVNAFSNLALQAQCQQHPTDKLECKYTNLHIRRIIVQSSIRDANQA
jgi:hypothetical protein